MERRRCRKNPEAGMVRKDRPVSGFSPISFYAGQKIRLFPEGFLRKQPFSFSGRDKYCPAPFSREET
ncbi:MAG: hypothetical protein CW346_11480 [Bacillaceae bacterium]|nr:hypothetical protein [Bacillaceae bacterium]